MKIDIEEYLLNKIGDTSWQGETNHDNQSLINLQNLDKVLYELDDIRITLIGKLEKHIDYRKGNASAELLHKKAKDIMSRHIHKEFTHTDFESYWEN